MPKLKSLSGKDLIKIFKFFGFSVRSQKGSHVKIVRVLETGIEQTLIIPNHIDIDKGTI